MCRRKKVSKSSLLSQKRMEMKQWAPQLLVNQENSPHQNQVRKTLVKMTMK